MGDQIRRRTAHPPPVEPPKPTKGGQTMSNFITFLNFYKADAVKARKKIIEVYQANKGNISKTARDLQCDRKTVRKAVRRYEEEGEEGLKDRSRRPKTSPNKTSPQLELAIRNLAKNNGWGRDRIFEQLHKVPEHKREVTVSKVRYTLRRLGIKGKYKRSIFRSQHRFFDFEGMYPMSHFQIDVKEIYDQSALSKKAIANARRLNIPPYQFTAIDIKTRVRYIAYAYEKNFTTGLNFMLSIIYYVRSMGFTHTLILQTDNGVEFGGPTTTKYAWLNKEIFMKLNTYHIHIPPRRKEYNAFVERSHRTDDEEFYIPQLEKIESLEEFYVRAWRWEMYYNYYRHHSTIKMTPFEKLRSYYPLPKMFSLFPLKKLDKLKATLYFYNKEDVEKGIIKVNNNPDLDILGGDDLPTRYTNYNLLLFCFNWISYFFLSIMHL